MRIVHVTSSSRGGGAVYMRRVARSQAAAGHRVVAVMPDDGEITGASLEALGIDHRDPGQLGPHRLAWLSDVLRTERADVVHCYGGRAAFWSRLASLGVMSRRPRLIYALAGFTAPYRSFPKRQAMWLAERALDPLTDAYVPGSEAEGEDARAFGLDAHRLHIIHNGVDVTRFSGGDQAAARRLLGLPPDAFVLITACRLDQPRDPGLFLRVLARLAQESPTPRLVIVGGGPLRAPAEALAVELGVRPWVSFLGYRQDLPRILPVGDVFLHATTGWEGSVAIAMQEGMAAGLPVVATRAGGIPEGVVEGETGFLVPVGDDEAMAAAVRRFRDDPALAARCGAAGRALVASRFTIGTMVEANERLYRRLLAVAKTSA